MLIPKTTRTRQGERGAIDRAAAEALALRGLAWIAGDDDRLMRFLGLTGTDLDALRARAADPAFLGGVLDCLLGDEGWVIEFAGDAGLDPMLVAAARRQLPGAGQEDHS
ncbi:uncharacterized protein DUF3572 [Stella humosa]|uniref:Uncharacterized protein DUF3572 n=1 Tax=Stella humosa TaxID=94 RepID=A0A3N1KNP9_9PROT|nr:DUF3572 domain-containing protein [Stella humosa]ROP80872.1 uncharacterized protein DUF3572 [Stella humosa]BBK33335.1 hypothetical protein STHU_39690 [Stella humosa]